MIRFMSLMIKMPAEVFLSSLEILVRAMREIQNTFDWGVDAITDEMVRSGTDPGSMTGTALPTSTPIPETSAERERPNGQPVTVSGVSVPSPGTPSPSEQLTKEERKMPDKDLHGDDLKLVRYKIFFVKRDHEAVFYEEEDLVSDDMTERDFAAWKVAEFMQKTDTKVPHRWRKKKYAQPYLTKNGVEYLRPLKIPEDDKKFLRVYVEVLDRYRREDDDYDKRQADALEGIKRILHDRLPRDGGAGDAGDNDGNGNNGDEEDNGNYDEGDNGSPEVTASEEEERQTKRK